MTHLVLSTLHVLCELICTVTEARVPSAQPRGPLRTVLILADSFLGRPAGLQGAGWTCGHPHFPGLPSPVTDGNWRIKMPASSPLAGDPQAHLTWALRGPPRCGGPLPAGVPHQCTRHWLPSLPASLPRPKWVTGITSEMMTCSQTLVSGSAFAATKMKTLLSVPFNRRGN